MVGGLEPQDKEAVGNRPDPYFGTRKVRSASFAKFDVQAHPNP
jgi:hypothetical protein